MTGRSTTRVVARLGATAALAVLVLLATVSLNVAAAPSAITRTFLIGVEPLCGLDPSACPVITMTSESGDTLALTGSGSFNPGTRVAAGGGTFVHRTAAGTVVGMGAWEAMTVLAFKSYGTDTTGGLPPNLEGGMLLVRVHISPASGGPGLLAVMTVGCLIGAFPAGAFEGVHLAVQGLDLNFNKEVSGFTVYILPD